MSIEMHVAAGRAQRQRRIVSAFEAAGAVDGPRSKSIEELGIGADSSFDRLLRTGIIREAAGGRYFLSREAITLSSRRRTRDMLIALVAIASVVGTVIVWRSL